MRLIGLTMAIVLLGCGGDDGSKWDGFDDDSDGADGGGDGSDGGDDGSDGADDGADDGDDGDDGTTVDGGAGDYVPLVTATWSLEPGDEGYICGTVTLTEDVYARALRPIAPLGTHHTTVDINPSSGEEDDPSFPCPPQFGDFWASGVGTGELLLPDGVALLAPAGQQLRVSLHLFNATDETLSGTSGLEVVPVDASEVEHTASVSYHGPMSFNIQAGESHTEVHQDTLGARTLVGIFPHMHQLGTEFRAVLNRPGGEPVVLWDDDYQFESQEFAPLPEVQVQSGDTLETSCTWVNSTKLDVGWGDSSEAEMCYSILMSY